MVERKPRRTQTGVVVSDKMDKTITVRVEWLVKHPRYGKYVRRYSRFKAHDAENAAREGDVVRIMETRKLARTKSWRLVEIVARGKTGRKELRGEETEPSELRGGESRRDETRTEA